MHFTPTLATICVVLCHVSAAVAQTSGWTPELMMQVKRVASPRPSPSGSHVVFTVATPNMRADTSEWVSQIWVARADGGDAIQLTRGARSATAPEWSPDGRWVAFIANRTGSNQIFRVPVEGGEPEQITTHKGGVASFEWSPDGKWIAYVATEPKSAAQETAEREKRDAIIVDENPRYARLYLVSAETGGAARPAAKQLATGDQHVAVISWSPDSKVIVFSHAPTLEPAAHSDVSTIDITSGKITPIATTPAWEGRPFFSPDGKYIAHLVFDLPTRGGMANRIHVVPATGGTPRKLHKTFDERLALIGWSADSRSVYFTEQFGTSTRLGRLPADGAPPEPINELKLHITDIGLNASGSAVAVTMEWADTPPEVYVTGLPRAAVRQISKVQALPNAPLPRTEIVRWKSPDGNDVEGLLTYPVGYRAGSRAPLLTYIHGGPIGASSNVFVATPAQFPIAAFAARGYAVLRVNFRASIGYGVAHRLPIVRNFGPGPFRDIMSGVDHVIAMGVADPERLGIMGRSYGGYMAAWAIAHTKRFKAASAGSPMVNNASSTGATDMPSWLPEMMGGEVWDSTAVWLEQSPLFHMKGVTTPTLIEHGEKDLRISVTQAYELYYALKRQGVPVRLVIDPRQPHAIVEPKLMLDAMNRNLEWFDRWLKPTRPASQPTSEPGTGTS